MGPRDRTRQEIMELLGRAVEQERRLKDILSLPTTPPATAQPHLFSQSPAAAESLPSLFPLSREQEAAG
jgi:hypothetical protein